MFEAFLKKYCAIFSESSIHETLDRTNPIIRHESFMNAKETYEDAVDVIYQKAEWIIEKLKKELGDKFNECVSESYKYGFLKLGGNNVMISYEIHVTNFGSVIVYKGDIIAF